MMRCYKKCLAFLMVVLMILSTVSVSMISVSAAEITENGVTFSTDTSKNTASVIGYTAKSSADEVVIPEEIEGFRVNGIAQSAFRFNDNIISVTFPKTLRFVSGYAFDGSANLEEVNTNGAEITSVGAASFRRCSKLKSLELGNSLKSIGSAAFKESGIESLVIPDTCETIESSAFSQCAYLKSIKLPSVLTSVEANLFSRCSALAEVEVPENVTNIATDAFDRCTALETVKLGNKLEKIDQRAFYNCTKLKNIVLPESLTFLSVNVFWDCDSLEEINVPSGVTSLAFQAFRGCDKLKTVFFSQGLKKIGDRVFANCDSIKNVIVPATVTTISDTAFVNCKDVVIYGVRDSVAHSYAKEKKYGFIGYEIDEKGNAAITSFDCPQEYEVDLPSSLAGAPLTEIADSAFRGNKELKSIKMPSTLKRIGEHAFEGCTGLENIEIAPESTYIGKYAFADCTSLKNICMPDGFATIDEYAFGFVSSGEGYVPSEDFCIYGSYNSGAYKYCKDNSVDFRFGQVVEVATGEFTMAVNWVEKPYEDGDKYRMINMLGDANLDKQINVKDATFIQKVCADLAVFEKTAEPLADTTLDGRYNVKDATQIQKYVASLIDSFYK